MKRRLFFYLTATLLVWALWYFRGGVVASENGGVLAFRLTAKPRKIIAERLNISTNEIVKYQQEWVIKCRLRNLDGITKKVRIQFNLSDVGQFAIREKAYCVKPYQRRTVSEAIQVDEDWQSRTEKDSVQHFLPSVKVYEAIPSNCISDHDFEGDYKLFSPKGIDDQDHQ